MSIPGYIFRIDEIREKSHVRPAADNEGYWMPPTGPGRIQRIGGGVSGTYWLCNGTQIYPIPSTSVPQTLSPYKTFSVFYTEGRGFRVLHGDGTDPPPGEAWGNLRFDNDINTYTSYLTNAGTDDTLRWQRNDQTWPRMLLPDIYHGLPTSHQNYGGLTGDLPIFLALVAMSMSPENLIIYLPQMFVGSTWLTHGLPHGRIHKRGVVVYVFMLPETWQPRSTREDLKHYEEGQYNAKYYH